MYPSADAYLVVKYVKGGSVPVNDLEGYINVESDCEDHSMGIWGRKSKEIESRAVLITGSFSAYVSLPPHPRVERNDELSSWKSLFFYRCTDVISLAPLKSQGVDARLRYVRARMLTATPPPCSPKSIYVLASLVSRI